ncbi:acetolactate synthase large subunit [Pseudolactococcus carnosus]|uniref:acetolactate synthase large subunit n=1 Tax=Pseudolactococcus carnosus TaxID=2749961 RepID=UPI0008125770|nr:acetolactate synthase large subunit [Lactococcus carnosus]SCA91120.1 acetolactate synthase III, large subunit [Lactococcus piscium]MCJ1969969.1 acetolactate synthase large subunit [Lactococcus carnosus]MCJ1972814.1 acetolactate synthase large subunit [Lactococcus carnosus]MCJ1975247.1 acetolactate synthase large subunit [Lactococcus carnosus]MCJ1982067.1 acetolactate synthase large subunit [Lactococcus carnosus]
MKKIKLDKPRSGSQLVLDTLKSLGVDTIFGYPGGAVLPLYDALYDYDGIQHILARHEQGATHEAEGYAKSSGKLGVALVTSGPGATNAVTGIADANADSVPMLVFTGQVATKGIGKDAFQEADIIGITMPITKYNYQIRETEDIPRIITEAVHIATTGRPGPVVIDLPKDISAKEVTVINDTTLVLPSYQPTVDPNAMQLKKIVGVLGKKKRPLILVGGGVNYADAQAEFVAFAEKHQIPVVSSLLGLGAMPVDNPLFLGMGGMHGSYAANMALAETDYLINIGSRFDDRLASKPDLFLKNATVAHIDIDPAEIGKIVKTDLPVVGDAKRALEILLDVASPETNYGKWLAEVQDNAKRAPYSFEAETGVNKPQEVIKLIGEITDGEAIIVTDVGQHQMWAAQWYPYKNSRQLVTSGGLGTMGFGIPAAIGAKLANPDKNVIVFVGDGGFQMTNQELAILNGYGIAIKVILFNNHSLGMVRQWQESFYEERRSQSVFDSEPDFQLLAAAYGLKHDKFLDPKTISDDLKVITENVPMVLEVGISQMEQVYPMVPAGWHNDEMLGVKFNA